MAAGLLLLVCVGAVLYSAEAQDSYDGLADNYKKGVDLAMEQLNTHVGVHHHFRFLRSLEKSDIESGFGVTYLYHHFYLKPTRCAKGTIESDPQRCPFRNDRVSEFQMETHLFHFCSILMLFKNHFTATDGLRSLLQNSSRRDRVDPQTVRSLYPETETHRGHEDNQDGALQKDDLQQWSSYAAGCVYYWLKYIKMTCYNIIACLFYYSEVTLTCKASLSFPEDFSSRLHS